MAKADDTLDSGAGDDTVAVETLAEPVPVEAVATPEAAVEPASEAVATEGTPIRDERRDSIDPTTGALSAEALAIRAAEGV